MREQTAVEVLRIENDAVRVGASATAKAQKLTATAEYEAVEAVEDARLLGLKHLYLATGVESEAHRASLDYLLTLMDVSSKKEYVNFESVATMST